MENHELLQRCFQSLNEDLYRLQHDPQNIFHNPQIAINDIVSNGIYGVNLEDAQEYLYKHLDDIEKIKEQITTVIEELDIKDKTEYGTGNDFFSLNIQKAEDIKKALLGSIKERLKMI